MRETILLIDGSELEPLLQRYDITDSQAAAIVAKACHVVFAIPIDATMWEAIVHYGRSWRNNPSFQQYAERIVRNYRELSMWSPISTPDMTIARVDTCGSDYLVVLNRGTHS